MEKREVGGRGRAKDEGRRKNEERGGLLFAILKYLDS